MIELLIPALVAIACIFVIMKSAGFAITAISNYARKTGLSEYFIGFIIVSVGTSLPELSTAFFASLAGYGGLIIGDVLGADIIDVTVVLGLTAIIGRKINVGGKIIGKILLTIFVIALLPVILGIDGSLSRADGLIMLGAFVFYIMNILRKEGELGQIKKNVAWKNIWKDMFVFLGCLIALLLSARWLVISSVMISKELKIPVYIVGLVFVALGTTVPELTVEIRSVIKGMSGLAFGDIFGSVVVNTSLVLGFAAIINPIQLEIKGFIIAAVFMLLSVSLALAFIRRKQITWKHGIFLLAVYLVYLITIISQVVRG